MAKLKGIKAAMPALIGPALYKWCSNAVKKPEKVAELMEPVKHVDPAANEWGTYGLIEPLETGNYVHSLDGTAYMLFAKFSEKVLPGAVRDKELNKRLAKLVVKSGREPTKQEYAQVRDEVEAALLPKAFARDTVIPILIYADKMVFCTTSARKAEQAQVLIMKLCDTRNVKLDFGNMSTDGIGFMLTSLAKESVLHLESSNYFNAGTSGVFKREDKATTRVKDRDLSHNDVQKLFDNAYSATELGMTMLTEDDSVVADFTFTDKWVIKGLKLADKDELKDAQDAHATYWLYANYIGTIIDLLVLALSDAAADEEEL